MIHYLVVNEKTGEIESDCAYCGLTACTVQEDFDNFELPPLHSKVLVDDLEYLKMHEIDQTEGKYKNVYDKIDGKIMDKKERDERDKPK